MLVSAVITVCVDFEYRQRRGGGAEPEQVEEACLVTPT